MMPYWPFTGAKVLHKLHPDDLKQRDLDFWLAPNPPLPGWHTPGKDGLYNCLGHRVVPSYDAWSGRHPFGSRGSGMSIQKKGHWGVDAVTAARFHLLCSWPNPDETIEPWIAWLEAAIDDYLEMER